MDVRVLLGLALVVPALLPGLVTLIGITFFAK